MSTKKKRVRRTFSDEFKLDAVNLVVVDGYSFKAAAEAAALEMLQTKFLLGLAKAVFDEPASQGDSQEFAK